MRLRLEKYVPKYFIVNIWVTEAPHQIGPIRCADENGMEDIQHPVVLVSETSLDAVEYIYQITKTFTTVQSRTPVVP